MKTFPIELLQLRDAFLGDNMFTDAMITAIANAYVETIKFNEMIWASLNPAQQQKIAEWFIEDQQQWRDFWKKVTKGEK